MKITKFEKTYTNSESNQTQILYRLLFYAKNVKIVSDELIKYDLLLSAIFF